VWALALAAACSSGSEQGGTKGKTVETFDEVVEPLQAPNLDAVVLEDGGAGPAMDASAGPITGSGGSGGISAGGAGGSSDGGTAGISAGGSGGFGGDGGSAGGGGFAGDGGSAGGGGFAGDGGSAGGGGFAGDGGTAGGGGFGGDGGTSGGGGFGGGLGDPAGAPSAFWEMNDCSSVTRTLFDSSGNGIHATRTASTRCAPGISGQGVAFDEARDRIEALNAPQFELDDRLAVAAWINPSRADNNRPIVLKRRNDSTAFSLRLQNNQIQFSVTLEGTNRTVTTRAPITLNEWSHVAGVFDGEFVFLFVNGRQVGQVVARGAIADVEAPIRVGSTTQTQHFVGTLDNVWISTNGVNNNTIASLACVRRESTFDVSPATSGPQPAGTEFVYDLSIKNNDSASCSARNYNVNVFAPFPVENAFASPFQQLVNAGQTAQFGLHVSTSSDAEPATIPVQFSAFDFNSGEQLFGQVEYEVAEPTGCFVSTARELMIRRLDVVDDPIRTRNDGPASDPRTGAWTFGKLVEQLAPTPEQATELVERVFQSWESDQTVNSFTISARPAIRSIVLDGWPRRADGRIDIHRAPLQLLAIVNRFDLRNLDDGHAGEGRFVFGVNGPFGPMEFTMILEYGLPAANEAEALDWANSWHALSSHPVPSEAYNAALQAITERFAGRGRAPGRPNGSALHTLRSNEISLSFQWELREFRLDSDGFLKPAPVKLTPSQSFNGTDTLAQYVNANESSILAERHVVPDSFNEAPFVGGSVFNNIDRWGAFGITNPEARHKFSLNTCNGCHGGETSTGFLHVNPRFGGGEARLSGFLTGTTVFDPETGQQRRLADLARRKADLEAIVCPAPAGTNARTAPRVSIRKGIGRVH
jgi:hypothetical protein